MTYSQIKAKKAELDRLADVHPELSEWIGQSDLWCWLYSYFRINGQRISKDSVVAMTAGELKEDVSLSSYAFVKACKDVYVDMGISLAMDAAPDPKLVNRWAGMITGRGDQNPGQGLYRQNNPVVYEWDLIPVHFRTLNEELAQLFRAAASMRDPEDPLARAAFVHLELNRLYPYGEDTTAVSAAVLMYYIRQLGLPLPELSAGDVEYNGMIAEYVEKSNREPFKDMLERSVYNRLEAVLTLARQAADMKGKEA